MRKLRKHPIKNPQQKHWDSCDLGIFVIERGEARLEGKTQGPCLTGRGRRTCDESHYYKLFIMCVFRNCTYRVRGRKSKESGIGGNQNQNQRYEVSREGFPGYEVFRMGNLPGYECLNGIPRLLPKRKIAIGRSSLQERIRLETSPVRITFSIFMYFALFLLNYAFISQKSAIF